MTDIAASSPRRRPFRTVIAVIVLLLVAGGIVWRFLQGREEVAREAEREAPVAEPLRLARAADGSTIVLVDAAAARANGIVVAPADAAGSADRTMAYASVVDVATLADLSGAIATARTQAAAAFAKATASRAAYERATALYKDEQIGSLAAAQAAEATWRADAAGRAAAASAVAVQSAVALQAWGPAIGRSLATGDPLVARLLARQTMLVQLTLPPATTTAASSRPPVSASAQTPGGGRVRLRLLSVATRADPRVQGAGFYYLAPSAPGLLPGISLSVALSSPASVPRGAAIPPGAVVLAGGRPYVYAEITPGRYARRPVEPDRSGGAASGGQRAPGLAPGTRIVVAGAQALLSEEFRAGLKVGEE